MLLVPANISLQLKTEKKTEFPAFYLFSFIKKMLFFIYFKA